MLFEWSVLCGAEDPVLVVPWQDETTGLRFADLRDDPFAVEELAEAEVHPALRNALRALNAPRSPVFSAKCDAWVADAEEREAMALSMMVEEEDAARAGFLCYVDLLCRDRALFASLHQHQHLMNRLERRVALLESHSAEAEVVIRQAFLELDGPREGFAMTLYVKALGADEAEAYAEWGRALEAVTAVLRSRELFPQT